MKKVIVSGLLLLQLTINGKLIEQVQCSIQTGLMPPQIVDCQSLPPMEPDDKLIIKAVEKIKIETVIENLQVITGQNREAQ